MTEDGHVNDLAAAYVLGALEPDEAAWVEAHLAICPACQQVIDETWTVIDLLAYAPPALTPPATVRDGLFRQLAPVASPVRGLWRGWWRPAVLAASLVLAVGLGATSLVMHQQVQEGQAQLQSLAPRATREARVVAMMVAPQATTVPLQPASVPAAAAAGRLLVDRQLGKAMLVVRQLPALPAGQTYQVWLSRDRDRHTAGTFQVSDDGDATLEMSMPDDLATYRWLWVTVEPMGGSSEPTGLLVLGASL
jgi:anti-sigma-K factor RskA